MGRVRSKKRIEKPRLCSHSTFFPAYGVVDTPCPHHTSPTHFTFELRRPDHNSVGQQRAVDTCCFKNHLQDPKERFTLKHLTSPVPAGGLTKRIKSRGQRLLNQRLAKPKERSCASTVRFASFGSSLTPPVCSSSTDLHLFFFRHFDVGASIRKPKNEFGRWTFYLIFIMLRYAHIAAVT